MEMPESPSDGMSSTFTASTHITLWFTTWTTTSTAAYVLTVIFVFSMGLLNRFFSALKSQLEWRWNEQSDASSIVIYSEDIEKPFDRTLKRHMRNLSRVIYPESKTPSPIQQDEAEPLSPVSHAQSASENNREDQNIRRQGFWAANCVWNARKHGTLAILEFVRALLGYML